MEKLIKATSTDERWGYRKGDILRVKDGYGAGYVVAQNLTRKDHYGLRNSAILAPHEFDVYKAKPEHTVTKHKLFGIPVWTKTIIHYEREMTE